MSLPTFPDSPPIKIEDAASMILASIAMEELGFSHIINAEGEKLQYVLNTLPNCHGDKASIKEIIEVNNSIKSLLDSILQNQMLLKSKLECAAGIIKENCERNHKPPKPPYPPPKPPCPSCHPCCHKTVSYSAFPSQNWSSGKMLQWKHSECHGYKGLRLSQDGKRIILKHGKCYTVGFAANICPEYRENVDSKISISFQLLDSRGKEDLFVYHAPAARTDSPITVSASGIAISTLELCDSNHDTDNVYCPELAIVLLCPCKVFVKNAGICVTEI